MRASHEGGQTVLGTWILLNVCSGFVCLLQPPSGRRAGGQRWLDETEGYSVLGWWAVGCGPWAGAVGKSAEMRIQAIS